MSPENVQEEAGGEERAASFARFRSCAAETSKDISNRGERRKTVAFKFGGSSLLGAQRMVHAASLVREAAAQSKVAVVVSAMKGVTDKLLGIARLLEAGKVKRARLEAEAILHFHVDVLGELQLEEEDDLRVQRELLLLGRDLLHEIAAASHGTRNNARSMTDDAARHDRLASFGERLCARLFAAALEKLGVSAVPVSSSDFVITCETFQAANPDLEETYRVGQEVLGPLLEEGIVPVVTGFLGTTRDGRVTTLGRNSSDYSGAIIACVVDADELVIWTDVDGVYTANPNESEEARLLHELSYDEAHALAAAGAKVLHAKVLPLAAENKIVVRVRNTFKPQFRGTKIGPADGQGALRGEA